MHINLFEIVQTKFLTVFFFFSNLIKLFSYHVILTTSMVHII